jgi:hypothetical protein
MLEIVDSVIIGPFTHRTALYINGYELSATECNDWSEAVEWARAEWNKRKAEIGIEECKRLGWVEAELRYWG